MAYSRPPLPPWLAPAAGVGVIAAFKRKPDAVEVMLLIPIGGRALKEVALTMTVPEDPNEVTALATALGQLEKILLRERAPVRQLKLPRTED